MQNLVKRSGCLTVLSVLAVALAFVVPSARADQITLGNNTCTGGPWDVTAKPKVTGGAFICTEDSNAKLSGGSVTINDLSYKINPIAGGKTASISITCGNPKDCAGNSLVGKITWTSSTPNGAQDLLIGSLVVSKAKGFNSEFKVGSDYGIDLTLLGCSSISGGLKCTDPSGKIDPLVLVPEPTSMLLLGTGLIWIAGMTRIRRRG
jgi:hypothetical protein